MVVSSLSDARGKTRRGVESGEDRVGANFFFFHYASVGGIAVHREPPDLGFNSRKRRRSIPGLFWKAVEAEAPEKTVFGIVCFFLRGLATGGLTIGVTEHDRAVKIFEFPTPWTNEGGQPIQQFRMGRFFAQETEVVGASDEVPCRNASANAVYDDRVERFSEK